MNPEVASEHESGDCTVHCTHPDCIWVGAVDVSVLGLAMWDDVEDSARQLEPVLL